MPIRIPNVREITQSIGSPIRNADIDFSTLTTSLAAVVTNIWRDGKRVAGYSFNSNGRYGKGGRIRERFTPRLLAAEPDLPGIGFEGKADLYVHMRDLAV